MSPPSNETTVNLDPSIVMVYVNKNLTLSDVETGRDPRLEEADYKSYYSIYQIYRLNLAVTTWVRLATRLLSKVQWHCVGPTVSYIAEELSHMHYTQQCKINKSELQYMYKSHKNTHFPRHNCGRHRR